MSLNYRSVFFQVISLLFLMVCFPQFSVAVQQEVSVTCDEGVIAEPILISYGEFASGCSISPATDLDTFTFSGEAGDIIRFSLNGSSRDLDSRLEVRGPNGSVLVDTSCTTNNNSTLGFFCGFIMGVPLFMHTLGLIEQ